MIGQKDLLDKIQQRIDDGTLSRFLILLGSAGCGKKTVLREIANKNWKNVYELEDVKVDTIRNMISDAYKVSVSTVYIIPDAQNMSVQAKNAILKVVEEPPHKASFFMSATSVDELLPTIVSRGSTYYIRRYSKEELQEYLDSTGKRLNARESDLILEMSSNISDIQKSLKTSPIKFENYVLKVIENLDDSPTTVFTYSDTINFKDDEDKYDLILFWRLCCIKWREKIDRDEANGKLYADLISETVARMSDVRQSAINKVATFDIWIMNCRKLVKKWKSVQ